MASPDSAWARFPRCSAAAIVSPIAFSSGGGSPIFDFVLPHTFSAPIASLLTLGHARRARPSSCATRQWLLPLAGALLGLVAVTRPEAALAPAAATLVWLALSAWAGARHPSRMRDGVRVALTAVVVGALGYAPFVIAVGPRELVWTNLYPVDLLRAGGNTVISSTAPFTLRSALVLAGFGALYAVIAFACLAVGRGRGRAGLAWLGVGGCRPARAGRAGSAQRRRYEQCPASPRRTSPTGRSR